MYNFFLFFPVFRGFFFFARAKRRNDRDLVTRRPGEISSFPVDIERRIYKSKRGNVREHQSSPARSRIRPTDISDLSMPVGIYERVVCIVIGA